MKLVDQLLGEEPGDLFSQIRAGSRVTILNRFNQKSSGRAVMFNRAQDCWVLNMGGAHGTPAIASRSNVVAVSGGKGMGPFSDR